jgi:UDP-GlcNAc:undecaprenyl-phosphate GlcNAc-1-phosphate transferase
LYVLACAIVVVTGTSITRVTSLGGHGAWSLVWQSFAIGSWHFSFPADIFTLGWLLAVLFATKFMDGLDGLVTGQTTIGAGLIAALTLSAAFFQPPVTILAILVAAAYLGFLPWNIHPAKQFLGESGSVIAGFALGFLSIVSGAKLATALMALGLPLVDVAVVMIGRLIRRVPLWQGDRTHLHFRLLEAGLSQRQSVVLLWLIALAFGIAALTLQTRGKILLLLALILVTVLLSVGSSMKARKK